MNPYQAPREQGVAVDRQKRGTPLTKTAIALAMGGFLCWTIPTGDIDPPSVARRNSSWHDYRWIACHDSRSHRWSKSKSHVEIMDTSPRRPWYQFSLRTFFALVMLACAGIGLTVRWVQSSQEWFRQRQAALHKGHAVLTFSPIDRDRESHLPFSLWIVGAGAYDAIYRPEDSPLTIEQIKQLFRVARLGVSV